MAKPLLETTDIRIDAAGHVMTFLYAFSWRPERARWQILDKRTKKKFRFTADDHELFGKVTDLAMGAFEASLSPVRSGGKTARRRQMHMIGEEFSKAIIADREGDTSKLEEIKSHPLQWLARQYESR